MTFLSAFWQADIFGKGIFLFLFALSIISWAFFLHKIWLYNQVRKVSRNFHSTIDKKKDQILQLGKEELPKIPLREIPHPFAHIFAALKNHALQVLNKNRYFQADEEVNFLSSQDCDFIKNQVEQIIFKQKENLDKNFFILSTIVTLSPFLGLLGTVWGILITFSGLASSGNSLANPTVLSGLSTALCTTVLGLLIAIPTLIAHNYLRSISRRYLLEMLDFSNSLIATIELQYRRVERV